MSYPSSLKSLVGEGKRSLSTRQGEWGSGPKWPALGHMTSLGQPAQTRDPVSRLLPQTSERGPGELLATEGVGGGLRCLRGGVGR